VEIANFKKIKLILIRVKVMSKKGLNHPENVSLTQQNIIKPQINKWGGDQIHNPNTIRGQGVSLFEKSIIFFIY